MASNLHCHCSPRLASHTCDNRFVFSCEDEASHSRSMAMQIGHKISIRCIRNNVPTLGSPLNSNTSLDTYSCLKNIKQANRCCRFQERKELQNTENRPIFVALQCFPISDHMSFPKEYDSMFKVHPYSCIFSCATVRQRNDTLGNDTWAGRGKIVTQPKRSILSYL